MSDSKPITMTAGQTHDKLPDSLRNDIYAALLGGNGIRNIESTLNHQMQATGFKSTLKAYINHLLRSGEVTTFNQIMTRVEAKVLHDTQAARNKDAANGVNGVNGHSTDSDEYNLALPSSVTYEGTKTVLKELEKVCEITPVDQNQKLAARSRPNPPSSGNPIGESNLRKLPKLIPKPLPIDPSKVIMSAPENKFIHWTPSKLSSASKSRTTSPTKPSKSPGQHPNVTPFAKSRGPKKAQSSPSNAPPGQLSNSKPKKK